MRIEQYGSFPEPNGRGPRDVEANMYGWEKMKQRPPVFAWTTCAFGVLLIGSVFIFSSNDHLHLKANSDSHQVNNIIELEKGFPLDGCDSPVGICALTLLQGGKKSSATAKKVTAATGPDTSTDDAVQGEKIPSEGAEEIHGSNYAMVFDLGSSGSRVSIFRWDPKSPIRSLVTLGSQKVNPGVSYYTTTTNNLNDISTRVGASLLPLLQFARVLVPPERRGDTVIVAAATAGVRHLPRLDLKQAVMNGVFSLLSETEFKLVSAAVIPGWQEAIFDWLALNGALGLLSIPGTPTAGAIDLGGASSQIAYAISDTRFETQYAGHPSRITPLSTNGTFRVQLSSGLTTDIYAISLSHYGAGEAMDYVVSADIDGSAGGVDGPLAPQLPNDFGQYSHPCLMQGVYTTTRGGNKVFGTGNARRCYSTVKEYFRRAGQKDLGNIKFAQPEPIPNATKTQMFMAFDHILAAEKIAEAVMKAKMPRFLKAGNIAALEGGVVEGVNFTRESLEGCLNRFTWPNTSLIMQAAELLCPMHWETATLEMKDKIKDPLQSCFLLPYVVVLLEDVYGFNLANNNLHTSAEMSRCPLFRSMDIEKQYPDLSPETIKNVLSLSATYDSSWALGAMVFYLGTSNGQ